jgi:glycosyltransferase involved in cell wall biosynthesis
MRRIAILFDNFGPYHLARLRAASGVCDVLAVEFGSSSAEYDWEASVANGLQRVALNERGSSRELSRDEFKKRLFAVLNEFKPEAVVVPGWGYRGALLGLCWGLFHRVPVICMSESTQWDEVRNPIKEWIKRRIIGLFSSALVGGTPHRAYMQELEMPADRIFLGYDVVDNGFFSEKPEELGGRSLKLDKDMRPYFLASARFIEKKNLPTLLGAYFRYRKLTESSTLDARPSTGVSPWNLILLGEGAMRSELEKLRSELGLGDCVQMPGFKQYEELPSYYAHAGTFIHASTTEQWGLVVNEAMASGLPVLVSNRCGCAVDLVKNGENGWTFDPNDEELMADLMLRIASDEEKRKAMGFKSREIIEEWGPDRFATGVKLAIEAGLSARRKKAGLLERMILKIMISR